MPRSTARLAACFSTRLPVTVVAASVDRISAMPAMRQRHHHEQRDEQHDPALTAGGRRRRGANAAARCEFDVMARSTARCETGSWFPAPCSGSAAASAASVIATAHGIVEQNISSGPGVTAIDLVLVAARDDRDRAPRGSAARSPAAAAAGSPPTSCRWRAARRSTVPSLSVSRPNCAFRLTTLLTAGVTGCTVGSRLCVCSVFVAGIDGVEGLTESRRLAGSGRLPQIDERRRDGAVGRRRCCCRASPSACG